jgi:hypothetical protein
VAERFSFEHSCNGKTIAEDEVLGVLRLRSRALKPHPYHFQGEPEWIMKSRLFNPSAA